MLNISAVTEESKRLGFMLDKCFVCKSHFMENSADGVTCGRRSCIDGLPLLLKDANDALLEEEIDDLKYDLNEAKTAIKDLKERLKKELNKRQKLASNLHQLLRAPFLKQVKDFDNQIEGVVRELSISIGEIKDALEL